MPYFLDMGTIHGSEAADAIFSKIFPSKDLEEFQLL